MDKTTLLTRGFVNSQFLWDHGMSFYYDIISLKLEFDKTFINFLFPVSVSNSEVFFIFIASAHVYTALQMDCTCTQQEAHYFEANSWPIESGHTLELQGFSNICSRLKRWFDKDF